jgi:hypothetical protein
MSKLYIFLAAILPKKQMENRQQIVEITINLTHDCGIWIPQTPFVEPLGVIHVAGRRQGCGR